MEGRIRDIIPMGAKTVLTLELAASAEKVGKYTGKDVEVEIRAITKARSLSQNAYYWTLINQFAAHRDIRVSTARAHNMLLREHPRPFVIGGKVAKIPLEDTEDVVNEMLESVTFHVSPTSQVITGTDGKRYRTYIILRGSSDYNTEEMSVLLDDLIEAAQEVGIETKTPSEIARMREYERQAEQRKRSKSRAGVGRAVA